MENRRIPELLLSRNMRASFLLFFLVSLIYSNCLPAIWTYDDGPNILENQAVQIQDLSLESLYRSVFSTHHPDSDGKPGLNRPLSHMSFALNWYFGQASPIGFRAVNVGIHFLTAFILFLVIRALLQSPNMAERFSGDADTGALLSAALWAANPIQTQAVVYIVQRMASLACLFYVLATWCYLKARMAGTRRSILYSILAVACFFAALASKENAILWPASILLIEFTFYRDLRQSNVKRQICLGLTVVTGALLVVGAAIFFEGPISAVFNYGNRLFTPLERLLTEPRVVWFYLGQMLYPTPDRLSIVHDLEWSRSLFDPWITLPALLGIAGLIVLGLCQMRNRPMLSFAVLFFLLNHVIESSLIGLELIYEHRNYLPSLFVFVPISMGLYNLGEYLRRRNPSASKLMASLGILLVAGWGAGTYTRNLDWLDDKTFWEDAASKAPLSMRPVYNLACYHYERRGEYEKAFELYTRASQMRDENRITLTLPHVKMADYYERKGDLERTSEHLGNALQIYPGFERVRLRQAVVLAMAGHSEQALEVLRPLIEKRPDSFDCNFLQSQILVKLGRPGEALSYLSKCMERSPEPKVFLLTGIAMNLIGDLNGSERFLGAILDRFPSDRVTQLWMIACKLQRDESSAASEYAVKFLNEVPPDQLDAVISNILTGAFMPDQTRELITRWFVRRADRPEGSGKS